MVFIETPYRKVKNGHLTEIYHYFTANEELNYVIAQSNARTKIDKEGNILDKVVMARHKGQNLLANIENVNYIDVSPKQIVSVVTACIPFLENDDANRALMGTNMQRQAIPLIKPSSPYVGTGMEYITAKDSGLAIISEQSGKVTYVDAKKIIIKNNEGAFEYQLANFRRSNHGTSISHNPLVRVNDKVSKNQVIADGPSMEKAELALGQNVWVAFTTWRGYNYEDAIIISERLVKDDVFTSIHIQEFKIERRKTKQGFEEITREIPNVSERDRAYLDDDGLIIVGTEIKSGDILVGKVTPKGHIQLSPEDKLLHAIFGEKSKNVRDTSLRVPNGGWGVVQSVKRFHYKEHDLSADILEVIKVYVVQKRKIREGDKMAGRHGNKGVISIVLPEEDMPYTADGKIIDILLNPLGVPSRMNIGQILEMHLGHAAYKLNKKMATGVFNGATNDELIKIMKFADIPDFGKQVLYDGINGNKFNEKVAIGLMYMLKLSHMVDDKLHARNVGPYSLITQQPLGGKALKWWSKIWRNGSMGSWSIRRFLYSKRNVNN